MTTDTIENMLLAFYDDDENDFFNLDLADEIVAAYPTRAEAHAARARALFKFEEMDEAMIATDEALRLDAHCADAIRVRANFLEEREGKIEASKQLLDAALARNPNHYGCLLARGYLEAEHGDVEAGVKLLVRAAKVWPDARRPANNLAFYCAERGRIDLLTVGIESIEAQRPLDGQQLYNVGTVLHEAEHYEAAIGYLDRSRALLGEENAIQHNRALCLEELTRYQEAIDEWSLLLNHEPNWDWPLQGRVRCYRKLGNNDAALADVARLLDLNPHDQKARQYETGIYYDLDDYPKMLATATVLVKDHPDDAWAENMHGVALRQLKEPTKARAAFLRAIALKTDYARAHHNLARLEVEEANYADAQKHAEMAISLDPTEWDSHHFRAQALAGQKLPAEAAQVYTRWLAEHPDDKVAGEAYAQHLRDQKDWKAALAAFERVFDQFDPKAHLAWHIGECHKEVGNTAAASEWLNKAKAQYTRANDAENIAFCDSTLKSLTSKGGFFSKLFG